MNCNLFIEDLVRAGQPTFLANPDGTCKTANCRFRNIGKHPRREAVPSEVSKHSQADVDNEEASQKGRCDTASSSVYPAIHVYALGDEVREERPSIHSTAIAVGPRAVLCCLQSLTLTKGARAFEFNYTDEYFIQPSVEMVERGELTDENRIPIKLHAFSSHDNWAVLLRTDGEEFESYAEIHVPESDSFLFSMMNQPVSLLHFPDSIDANQDTPRRPVCFDLCVTVAVVQSSSLHYLRYNASNTTLTSAGGALYLTSSPQKVFAMHVIHLSDSELLVRSVHNEYYGTIELGEESSKLNLEPDAPTPYIVGPWNEDEDRENGVVRTRSERDMVNTCSGRALILSQFPQLMQCIQEVNEKE